MIGDKGKHRRGAVRGRSYAPGLSAAFAKDTLRSWAHGWKRFVSIAAISLLGVAVLTGIYAGCRDALLAADRLYDAQSLHDIQVLSTYGLTDDDVAALRNVDGVADVQPERSQSVETPVNGTDKTVTITEITDDGMDRPYLQKGRMPTQAGEIAVTAKFLVESGYKIGDDLTVTPVESDDVTGLQDDSGDAASVDGTSSGDTTPSDAEEASPEFPTELTIVGQVLDPKDLNNPEGYSTAAFRKTVASDYTFFAPSDGVTGNIYTAINLTVEGAAGEDSFSDEYDRLVREVADRIGDDVQAERQRARRDQITDNAQRQLDAAKTETYRQLDAAQTQINEQQANIDAMSSVPAGVNAQLDAARQQIADAQSQLDAQRQRADEEFAEQQQSIDDVADATWYVQTRSSISGFSSFESDMTSIEAIGRAFPVVFLIVAVLMSLTTMTRMVEEERGLVGTYTGLGYGHVAIAMRYVLFAMLACLIGGGLGLLAGFLGIPAFLLTVVSGLYVVPNVTLEYDWLIGSGGIALFVVGVVVATAIACVGEMRQTPAALMRPKAPKAGARVLLERIPAIWNRLSFLNKVTVRNIVRFKSRLIMTVGGVAGCTALIVCGFAINDSVDTLGVKQYGDIYRYDMMVVSGDADADTMRDVIAADGKTEQTMDLRIDSGEMTYGNSGETVQLTVVPDGRNDDLNTMIALNDVSGGHGVLSLDDSGVIVAQSASNVLGVEAGDTITLRDGAMRHADVKVAAISRNLIGSDVYISESLYRSAFDVSAPLTWNAMLATLDGTDAEKIEYVQGLGDEPSVLSAISTDDMRESFGFDLMSAVVVLIVGLAGGLALVVLFTLSNTNVSERVREMATLKVLGFYDREVHTYVNKEMMILTGLGTLIGLPFGRWIGGLLTAALNMPSLYFEVEIKPWSYLIAAAVTMAFAVIVHLFTNPVLDRIDPVSSLKSVE